jgi:hypothetical protein
MKDCIKGECVKLERWTKELIEKENESVLKNIDYVETEIRKVKDVMGNSLGEFQKGTDNFTLM